THCDETDVSQDLEVLGDRRLLELERIRNLTYRALLRRDELEDVPTPRLGNRVERIGRRRGARHELTYIFPYGNVSSEPKAGPETVPAFTILSSHLMHPKAGKRRQKTIHGFTGSRVR